ncbi:MAG: sulfatase-like hydrolase/transferase [Frankiaceae bacterium]|nr:sulfatase-like hydrolase/transferase [Frankiaceae bacterium]
MPDDEAAAPPRTTRSPWRRLAELFVLCSFAIAQPLLDITGRSPETFVFYRVGGLEVVLYAAIVVVVPPVVLWLAVSGITRLSTPAGRIAQAVVAGALIGLTALQAAKKVSELRGPVLVVVALVVAVGALSLYARSTAVQSFVTYLTPAPLVFALLFVLTSPTGDLVRPAEAGSAGGGGRAGGTTPPIVMVLLDELPLVSLLDSAGQVDERVYPNFARLAGTSHWFRNATGIGSFTSYAVPGMLSGRYPEEKLVPSYVDHPDNLFSFLAPDYRIRAFETITQLCDPARCDNTDPAGGDGGLRGLLGQTWQVARTLATPYDDDSPASDQFAETSAGTVTTTKTSADTLTAPKWKTLKANQPERFQRFIAGLRPRDKPTLNFLHLLLPHHPWRYLPSGATHPDKLLGGRKGGWANQAWPMAVNRQAQLLQLAYTDRLLGEVIDRLEKQGIWDDALVVVTADHGEGFLPGGAGRKLTDRPESQAQVAWVPMFMKEPGQSEGTTSDANWEHVDLLPTLADALGRELPFKVDGISQLSGSRERSEKYWYNWPGRRSVFPESPAFQLVQQGVTDTFVDGSAGQAGLYTVGSRPDWIGKPVSGLTSLGADVDGAPSPMTASVSDELDFDAVDPASGSVPSLVTGTLQRSAGRGPVVIAVNGLVGAVSEIYPEAGKPSFAGLVNDALFRAGDNDLALYEIVGDTTPRLRPIRLR